MYPILFTIGNWSLYSYDVMYALGGIIGGVIGVRMTRTSVPAGRMLLFYLVVFPVSIAAGLLNGMLFNPVFHSSLKTGQPVLEGGIVTYGAIAAAFLVTWLFSRSYPETAGRDLDRLALAFAVMLIFFRFGCLLNGCCNGRETDGFGGLLLPDIYGDWQPRYPTQLLLIGLNAALAAGLWIAHRKNAPAGSLAAVFLFCFGLGRLGIDALRALPPVLGAFNLHMLADVLFLLAGAGLMLWRGIAVRRSRVTA